MGAGSVVKVRPAASRLSDMTVQAQRHTAATPDPATPAETRPDPAARLLPAPTPVRFLDDAGRPTAEQERAGYQVPPVDLLIEGYRRMISGRRFDAQATALTKQGRLAVYPSSHGQEACQVGGVLALRDTDWMFPTYRESMALVARGIDPVQALTLLRGDWHCGYDPTTT
ncbi:MAG: thiamine pyrophosphate-dependent enzyme, partial [Jiangellaceae bacterium]